MPLFSPGSPLAGCWTPPAQRPAASARVPASWAMRPRTTRPLRGCRAWPASSMPRCRARPQAPRTRVGGPLQLPLGSRGPAGSSPTSGLARPPTRRSACCAAVSAAGTAAAWSSPSAAELTTAALPRLRPRTDWSRSHTPPARASAAVCRAPARGGAARPAGRRRDCVPVPRRLLPPSCAASWAEWRRPREPPQTSMRCWPRARCAARHRLRC
mmetsp:Transcript_80347/g.239323  ORF Transcript_80347/g.239323 Transcript_80347/m.239323 type:complete len:213 (-) Transcript_80347:246-884(-)